VGLDVFAASLGGIESEAPDFVPGTAELRCYRCADKHPHRQPTYLGWAYLAKPTNPKFRDSGIFRRASFESPSVVVEAQRRMGRGRAQARGKRRREETTMVAETNPHAGKPRRSIKLRCHSCGLVIPVRLERLGPLLEHGYQAIQVGANGEVVPVGAPTTTGGSEAYR
jgi:hypothetical protein